MIKKNKKLWKNNFCSWIIGKRWTLDYEKININAPKPAWALVCAPKHMSARICAPKLAENELNQGLFDCIRPVVFFDCIPPVP